jgi:hypothetical protein
VFVSWLVIDSSNMFSLLVVVRVRFVWLVSDDSSNVVMCRLLVVWLGVLDVLVVYVMYVSMYEGRANYQYYALQGSE